MPFLLSNSGFDLLVWNLQTQKQTEALVDLYNLGHNLLKQFLKYLFAFNLLNCLHACSLPTQGIQHGKSYGSLDDTIITIEADESTPLLVDRKWTEKPSGSSEDFNNNKRNKLKNGSSLESFGSSNWSQGSGGSTKSFKSHFGERKVLAFAFVIMAGLGIAIYLLIIECKSRRWFNKKIVFLLIFNGVHEWVNGIYVY